jgi:hypothetical protein
MKAHNSPHSVLTIAKSVTSSRYGDQDCITLFTQSLDPESLQPRSSGFRVNMSGN